MDKRIEEILGGQNAEELERMELVSCKSEQISGFTQDFKSLKYLAMVDNGLTSLKGFPQLPELTRLVLDQNDLCGTLNLIVDKCPKLRHLSLGENKFKELDALAALKDLPDLKTLDIPECEISQSEGYRKKIFEMIPQLVYVDGYDKEDMEKEDLDSDEEPSEDEEDDEDDDDEDDEEEVGLSYLQKSGLDEEDEDEEDFEPNGTHDSDDEEDSEEDEDIDEAEIANGDEGQSPANGEARGRGVKRKRQEEATADKSDKKPTDKDNTEESKDNKDQ